MIAREQSFILHGIDATPCEVEIDFRPDPMPSRTIVGLPDAAVREAIQRVHSAIRNSGYRFPNGKIVINLAPADTPKEGVVYDLPIAIGLLRAGGTIDPDRCDDRAAVLADRLVAGELALDGRVRPIRGAVSLALLARHADARSLVLPADNAREAAVVDGLDVFGVGSLGEVVELLNGAGDRGPHPPVDVDSLIAAAPPQLDFGEIVGQEAAKRALTVAAAGAHNIVMIGPPGTGKSMLAKALVGILPPLTRDEALEVTRIYSSVGRRGGSGPLIVQRPVRTPHHTASAAAIIGGGSIPRPGDVSLAHRGVLFLDELPEFSRAVLETLRQPLEDGVVTIARASGSVRFPARFMLVAALNPTRQGDAASGEAGQRDVDRYLARLSRPLVDRIDIHIEVPPVPVHLLIRRRRGSDTASLRSTVDTSRRHQQRRQGTLRNADLHGRLLDRHAPLDGGGRSLLERALADLGLSARAYDRIRRVARTIADLEEADEVSTHHVAEAVQYRILDRCQPC